VSHDNQYWDELVSRLYNSGDENENKSSEDKKKESGSDYLWAVELKDRLKKVFEWDLFDKKEAKLRLDYRLRNMESSRLPFYRSWWLRAAVILIAVLSGALIHSLMTGGAQENLYSEIVVPMGQMTQVNLPDGSKVWLNSGSVFKYPTEFDRSARQVYIDGEAFMEVAKNKRKPFVVNTKKFSVEVLGTSFNVSAYSTENSANVTLVEGSVLLCPEDKKWSKNLTPGQSAMMEDGKMPEIREVNTDFYTTWKNGKIVFRKEILEEIARKLERWYNVEIKFKDESLKTLKFSGTFLKNKPIDQVFTSLSIMDGRIGFVYENHANQKDIIYIIKK